MAVVVEDSFTGVDANLTTHTPTVTGTGWALWFQSGTDQIRRSGGGTVRPGGTVASANVAYNSLPSPTLADVDVEWSASVIPTGTDDPAFLFARGSATTDWYAAGVWNDGSVGLYKSAAADTPDVTALATGSITLVASDVIRLEIIGTSIKLYQNDVERLSATDSTHSAAGKCGLGFGSFVNATDDLHFDWDLDLYKVTEYASATVASPLIAGPNLGKTLFRGPNL